MLKTAFVWLVNSLKMKGLLSFVLEGVGEKFVMIDGSMLLKRKLK